jgi:UDP:flavonoid glycosyltransferase YjiC (YdhE family)
VVTHAGHGTVIRALANGVPLVCIPMGRDQPGNAARVVARGAGLRLTPKADVAAIRDTIQHVFSDPKFRESAQRLGKAILEDVQHSTAIKELEQITLTEEPIGAAV